VRDKVLKHSFNLSSGEARKNVVKDQYENYWLKRWTQ